ncbi:hypothetical protein GQX73_g6966 [Xylaria multiplex]|uniref:Uncharacterized protein n=1 Tax=Xylaria multiplex TaxID=323545 RepID=A0A7C8IRX0_9PEZI|nr:hypothetical protein GQX73_g6966 [Xylaria multiplex]
MHPPLLYCPRSTQFKFRVVGERGCHLYPQHAPLLHLGANADDTVISAIPSGNAPFIEAVTHIPFEENAVSGGATGARTILQSAPVERSASFQESDGEYIHTAPSGQIDRSNSYSGTGSSGATQSTNTDSPPDIRNLGFPMWNHGNFASRAHNRPQWHAAQGRESNNTRNYNSIIGSTPRTNGQSPPPFPGHYANRSHPQVPLTSQCQSQCSRQYQYYPYQTAAMPPFHEYWGRPLPRLTSPAYGSINHYQHQGRASSPSSPSSLSSLSSHFGSNRVSPNPSPNNHRIPQFTQFNPGTSNQPPCNPQATIFQTHTYNFQSLHESRYQANLEQFQRPNDRTYYSHQDHVRIVSAPIHGDEEINAETSSPSVCNFQSEMQGGTESHGATRRGNSSWHRSRSLSESDLPRVPGSDIPSPTIQGDQNQSDNHHHEPNISSQGKEIMRSPSPTYVDASPPISSVQPAMTTEPCNEDRSTPNNTSNVPPYRKAPPQTWADLFRNPSNLPGPAQQEKPAKIEMNEDTNQPPPPSSPMNPKSTDFGLEQSLEKLDSLSRGPFFSGTVIKGTSSICSTMSNNSAAMTKIMIHNAPSEAASRRTSQTTLETHHSEPTPSAPPAQPTETVAASVSTEHRPRLWSQLLKSPGSSTESFSLKPRSESSIDESNWPSLGSSDLIKKKKKKKNRSC